MKNNKGFASLIVYGAIAAVGVFLLMPTWHLPAFLQKKPPTAQLSAAEVKLKETQSKLDLATGELAKTKAAEEQKKAEQLSYSQKMSAAAAESLSQVPAAHRTPEVILAEGFVTRANNGLLAAIGGLTPDQQAEIKSLVVQALSAKQSEVDAANKIIKDMDKQLADETAVRNDLDKKLPVLQAQVDTAQAEVKVKAAEVDKQQAAVVTWADKKAQADAKAGSLETYGNNLMRYIVIGLSLYLLVHFILPSLVQEFPGFSLLGTFYRGVTSVCSSHAIAPIVTTQPPK